MAPGERASTRVVAVGTSPGESYQFETLGGETVTVHPRFTFAGPTGILDDRLDVPRSLTPGSRDVKGTLTDVPLCPQVPITGNARDIRS